MLNTIREILIKTAISYHLTSIRMAIIKNLQTINAGDIVEKREPTLLYCWECKLVTATMETSMEIPQRTKIRTTT